MVTHGAIDGYSRLIVFLKCSNNNTADTVYTQFLHAVQAFGLPSRIRCDQGRENMFVVRHMLRHRGIERRSALVGASVHNQRVERLWKDVHRCVTVLFYRLFYHLEYNNLLDPINELHLYALQYIFLPRINKALTEFIDAWNNHGVRTQRAMTPNQMFTEGMLRLRFSGLTAMDLFDHVSDDYGVVEDGLMPEDDEQAVVVPRSTIELSSTHLQRLQSIVDPLQDSDDYGVALYQTVVRYLGTLNL